MVRTLVRGRFAYVAGGHLLFARCIARCICECKHVWLAAADAAANAAANPDTISRVFRQGYDACPARIPDTDAGSCTAATGRPATTDARQPGSTAGAISCV